MEDVNNPRIAIEDLWLANFVEGNDVLILDINDAIRGQEANGRIRHCYTTMYATAGQYDTGTLRFITGGSAWGNAIPQRREKVLISIRHLPGTCIRMYEHHWRGHFGIEWVLGQLCAVAKYPLKGMTIVPKSIRDSVLPVPGARTYSAFPFWMLEDYLIALISRVNRIEPVRSALLLDETQILTCLVGQGAPNKLMSRFDLEVFRSFAKRRQAFLIVSAVDPGSQWSEVGSHVQQRTEDSPFFENYCLYAVYSNQGVNLWGPPRGEQIRSEINTALGTERVRYGTLNTWENESSFMPVFFFEPDGNFRLCGIKEGIEARIRSLEQNRRATMSQWKNIFGLAWERRLPSKAKPQARKAILCRHADLVAEYQRTMKVALNQDPCTPGECTALNEANKKFELALEIEAEYYGTLPAMQMSRCPICDKPLIRSFDPRGLDGFWWRSSAMPEEPVACPHFCVLTGALNLNGKPPRGGDFEAHIGPQAPFVIPRLLAFKGILAVVSRIATADDYLAYPIAYFAERRPQPQDLTASWARTNYLYRTQLGEVQWRVPADKLDFDLKPWLKKGQLRWCEGEQFLFGSGTPSDCPFIDEPGDRQPTVVKGDQFWHEAFPEEYSISLPPVQDWRQIAQDRGLLHGTEGDHHVYIGADPRFGEFTVVLVTSHRVRRAVVVEIRAPGERFSIIPRQCEEIVQGAHQSTPCVLDDEALDRHFIAYAENPSVLRKTLPEELRHALRIHPNWHLVVASGVWRIAGMEPEPDEARALDEALAALAARGQCVSSRTSVEDNRSLAFIQAEFERLASMIGLATNVRPIFHPPPDDADNGWFVFIRDGKFVFAFADGPFGISEMANTDSVDEMLYCIFEEFTSSMASRLTWKEHTRGTKKQLELLQRVSPFWGRRLAAKIRVTLEQHSLRAEHDGPPFQFDPDSDDSDDSS